MPSCPVSSCTLDHCNRQSSYKGSYSAKSFSARVLGTLEIVEAAGSERQRRAGGDASSTAGPQSTSCRGGASEEKPNPHQDPCIWISEGAPEHWMTDTEKGIMMMKNVYGMSPQRSAAESAAATERGVPGARICFICFSVKYLKRIRTCSSRRWSRLPSARRKAAEKPSTSPARPHRCQASSWAAPPLSPYPCA